MKGIVWKELREWGPLTGALLVCLCLAWGLAGSATSVLIAPRDDATFAVLVTASLFGLALGYGQLGADRARGTLPYMAHREGGKRALLRGKLMVGVPLALAVGMLPPLVFFVQQSLGPLGAVVQPARAWEHALAGLAALPAYASGMFIVLVAPSTYLRFSLGACAICGCMLYSLWLPQPVYQMSPWAIPLFVLGELALAAAVLSLAVQFFLRGHDRDAVLPFRLQAGAAGFALLLFVAPSWWGFQSGVRNGQQSLFNGYPLLVRYADGHYEPMERRVYHALVNSGAKAARTFTLPDGTVGSEPEPTLAYNPTPPLEGSASLWMRDPLRTRGALSDRQRWVPLDLRSKPNPAAQFVDRDARSLHPTPADPAPGTTDETYLDLETGVVQRFEGLRRSDSAVGSAGYARQIVLSRPDGKPFSRETIVVMDEMQVPLLVDLEDKSTWLLDFATPRARLARIALPNDEPLLRVEPKSEWVAEGWSWNSQRQLVFVGAQGRYQWTTAGFKTVGAPETRRWWLRYCRGESGEASLTAMTVRLRNLDAQGSVGPESEVVFEQHYEPRTAGEAARAALMRIGILCGPPVLSALTPGLVSRVLPIPQDSSGVHLAHVLLGLALGAWTFQLVARRGGTFAERVLWSLFVALFGVLALAFFSMLAPRPIPATSPRVGRASTKPSPAPLAAT